MSTIESIAIANRCVTVQGRVAVLERTVPANDAIINDVISAVQEGRSLILLTERKDHLEYLGGRLSGFVRHLIVLQGGMTTKARSRAVGQLESIPDTAERLVLATGRPTYRAIGYARGEAPLGFAEAAEERTIEYDQEALRHFEEGL